MKELRLAKLKNCYEIWSAMMNYGQEEGLNAKLLTNSDMPLNSPVEIFKTLTFRQRSYTMPALFLTLLERLPKLHIEYYLELGNEFRKEINNILGTYVSAKYLSNLNHFKLLLNVI